MTFLSIKHWAGMLYYFPGSTVLFKCRMVQNQPVSCSELWRCHSGILCTSAVGSWHCTGVCFCSFSHAVLLSVSLIYSYRDGTCIPQRNNNQLLQWPVEHLAWNIVVQGRASVYIGLLPKTALNIRNKKFPLVLLPTCSAFSPHLWWRRARIRGPIPCARNQAYNRHRTCAVTE